MKRTNVSSKWLQYEKFGLVTPSVATENLRRRIANRLYIEQNYSVLYVARAIARKSEILGAFA